MNPVNLRGVYADHIAAQQEIVASMKLHGWAAPCGRDPEPRMNDPITLGDMYDRHAIALLVAWEMESRG